VAGCFPFVGHHLQVFHSVRNTLLILILLSKLLTGTILKKKGISPVASFDFEGIIGNHDQPIITYAKKQRNGTTLYTYAYNMSCDLFALYTLYKETLLTTVV